MSPPAVKLREQAIRLLARREHSYFELQQKLRHKGGDPDEIDRVLDDLRDAGLQSDQRFVESFINSRRRRGVGPTRIANELRERKIADNLINPILKPNDSDWIQAAEAVIAKKFGPSRPKEYPQRVKLMNFLNYRGFTHEQIRAVMDEEWE